MTDPPADSKAPNPRNLVVQAEPSLRPSARGRALILIVFVLLLGIACLLPALALEGAATQWRGIEALVLGPMALKFMQLAWLANLFALLALYRVMNHPGKLVIVFTAIAFVLSLDTLTLFGQDIALTDHGGQVRVVGLCGGFYVWLLTLLWPCLALMLLRIRPAQRVRGDFSG